MASRKFAFYNKRGARLVGVLDTPDNVPAGETVKIAVFAHCFAGSKDFHATKSITKALVDEGIGVFRFDMTGLGESGGDFAKTDFTSHIADIVEAAEFLGQQGYKVELLVGHSFGGIAAIMASHELPDVSAVVTVGSPDAPWRAAAILRLDKEAIKKIGEGHIRMGNKYFPISAKFIKDVENPRYSKITQRSGVAVMALHFKDDEVVTEAVAKRLFMGLDEPARLVLLEGGDHYLTQPADAQKIGQRIKQFFTAVNNKKLRRIKIPNLKFG